METSGYVSSGYVNVTTPTKVSFSPGQMQNAAPRERERGIEEVVKDLLIEMQETHNSAGNLADKLKAAPAPPAGENPSPPMPGGIFYQLEMVLEFVRWTNQQLSRAHSAISG